MACAPTMIWAGYWFCCCCFWSRFHLDARRLFFFLAMSLAAVAAGRQSCRLHCAASAWSSPLNIRRRGSHSTPIWVNHFSHTQYILLIFDYIKLSFAHTHCIVSILCQGVVLIALFIIIKYSYSYSSGWEEGFRSWIDLTEIFGVIENRKMCPTSPASKVTLPGYVSICQHYIIEYCIEKRDPIKGVNYLTVDFLSLVPPRRGNLYGLCPYMSSVATFISTSQACGSSRWFRI